MTSFHDGMKVEIKAADIERIKQVMEFHTLYGNDLLVLTADNCHHFDISLLTARIIAARTRGKFLAINAYNDLILLDSLPAALNEPAGIISTGYKHELEIQEVECCTEDMPRNRSERRHGRRAERPIWEHDKINRRIRK